MSMVKTPLQSKGLIGAAIVLLGAGAQMIGWNFGPDEQAQALDLAQRVMAWIDEALIIGAAALALWGNIKRTKVIAPALTVEASGLLPKSKPRWRSKGVQGAVIAIAAQAIAVFFPAVAPFMGALSAGGGAWSGLGRVMATERLA